MERGWTRNMYENEDGRVCLIGAASYARFGITYHNLSRAQQLTLTYDPFVRACMELIHLHTGYSVSVQEYNDGNLEHINEALELCDLAEKVCEQREAIATTVV